MAAPLVARKPVAVASTDELHDLVLRVWEATNDERTINGIQEAVAQELQPFVPFDAMAVLSFEKEQPRLHEMWFSRATTAPATFGKGWAGRAPWENTSLQREPDPYCSKDIERRWGMGKPFTCPDLLAKPAWQEHEYRLARAGMRNYVLLPLLIREKLIAAAIFSRSRLERFTAEQLVTLRHVAPALAAAVAHVLQTSKASELIDRLQAKNAILKAELNRVSRMKDEVDNGHTPAISAELMPISARLKNEERGLIEEALLGSGGRVSGPRGAATRLGMPASTLEFRIRRLGIDKFQYRRRNGHQAFL